MPRRLLALFAVSLMVLGTAPTTPAVGAEASPDPGSCTPDPVWFLGVSYDSAERDDFIIDIDNFEFYLSTLRETYCIPEEQAEILAMADGFTCPGDAGGTPLPNCAGKRYEDGSEANVKDRIAQFAAAANDDPDAIFFFFLSSHGFLWSGALSACGIQRATMSYSSLAGGDGEDGFLDDCELGDALNDGFDPHVRMFLMLDCSFCGGFSDSLTAASGSVPDGGVQGTATSSGVPGDNRIVVTGCAIATECFGSDGGGVSYWAMTSVLKKGVGHCDGWTAPGFPLVQGVNAPAKINPADGRCTASEWFWAAVNEVYTLQLPLVTSVIGIQEQFRIKYCMPGCPVGVPPGSPGSLEDDIQIM